MGLWVRGTRCDHVGGVALLWAVRLTVVNIVKLQAHAPDLRVWICAVWGREPMQLTFEYWPDTQTGLPQLLEAGLASAK